MVPLEPFEKVLVSKAFLDTEHGEIACTDCHGGNAGVNDKKSAHAGLDPYPAANNPEVACGECHDEEAEAITTVQLAIDYITKHLDS